MTDERGLALIGADTGQGSVHSPTRLPSADPRAPSGSSEGRKRHSVRHK